MKKTIFVFLFSINMLHVYSQVTIEIGQNAEYIKRLIEWQTNSHNYQDNYGNTSNYRWTFNVSYYDGKIANVIQCCPHQLAIDLGAYTNCCKTYVMKNGQLSYILTQFENISIQRLKESFNSRYSSHKKGIYYFSDDYQTYSKIYLAKNGMPTIEFRKTIISSLPKDIKQEVQTRINKNRLIQQQQIDIEKKGEEKRERIISKTYDLLIYKKNLYDSLKTVIDRQINEINWSENYVESKFQIPSFDDLKEDMRYIKEKKFRFSNTYIATYKLENHSRPSQDYGNVIIAGSHDIRQIDNIQLVSGSDSMKTLFRYISVQIPTILIEGIEVMTEVCFNNISFDFSRGITIVDIKNDNVTYLKYKPDEDIAGDIEKDIKTFIKGKNVVYYEVTIVDGVKRVSIKNYKEIL